MKEMMSLFSFLLLLLLLPSSFLLLLMSASKAQELLTQQQHSHHHALEQQEQRQQQQEEALPTAATAAASSQRLHVVQEATNWDLLDDIYHYHNAIRSLHQSKSLRFNRTVSLFLSLFALRDRTIQSYNPYLVPFSQLAVTHSQKL